MVVLIIFLMVVEVMFMVTCWKADWKTIDEQNKQYEAKGYNL